MTYAEHDLIAGGGRRVEGGAGEGGENRGGGVRERRGGTGKSGRRANLLNGRQCNAVSRCSLIKNQKAVLKTILFVPKLLLTP